MKVINLFVILILSLLIVSCGGSSLSTVGGKTAGHPVNVIAMNTSGGILGEAIAIELTNHNLTIIDPAEFSNIIGRLDINEFELAAPQNLTRLKDEGIDAFLVVKSQGGYDGLPQSASVRVTSTHNGKLISGVSWSNGYGGQAGSWADRIMRVDLPTAAKEIVAELIKNLQPGF